MLAYGQIIEKFLNFFSQNLKNPEPTPYEQMLYDEEPYTENIFESEEDEIPYDLPDRVPPEKIDKQ